MLRSENPTARAVLRRELAGVLVKPVDWALGGRDRRAERRADVEADDQPVTLVVGGPRSGTTIVYQVLASCLPVSYTSNWVGLFHRSPISAARLRRKWTTRPPLRPENYLGSVAGMAGPCDAFNIWNRYFGETRGEPEPLSPEDAAALRRFVAAWHEATGLPLLNKNNRNTLCLAQLAEALPNLRVVAVRRDPVYVAQSLIESRREVQGSADAGWGLLARDADPDAPLGHVDAVVDQVLDFDARLTQQLAALAPDRHAVLRYEDFCADPIAAVQRVSRMVFGHEQPDESLPTLPELTSTNEPRLTDAELARLHERLDPATRGQAPAEHADLTPRVVSDAWPPKHTPTTQSTTSKQTPATDASGTPGSR